MKNTMLCWPLHGVGLDNLGRDHRPVEQDIPTPTPDELLVRIDAIGLCFSDVKLIRAGEAHPRVHSTDLAADPVIPGHEAVMTIVEVGDGLHDKFAPGSRYIIQADIYVDGVGYAYGYAIDGGMAEYSILDQRVLAGDEGCYLLPLKDETPAGIAALIEPWTCVIASYLIEHRNAPKSGGAMLVAAEPGDDTAYRFSDSEVPGIPATVDCLNLNGATRSNLQTAFPGARFRDLHAAPADAAYDDVAMCGVRKREMLEALAKALNTNGTASFVGECYDGDAAFDIGRIHYQGWYYQGTRGTNIAAAYGRNLRSTLRKGGSCWLVGGAGAMGQMHTQLAVEDPDGPARVLVTDLDDQRIAKVSELLAPAVRKRGIEFQTLNPTNFPTPAAFGEAVREFAPDGFDDVVMLVPVVPVVNAAAPFLGTDAVMNVFAGIPVGKEATLNVGAIQRAGARFIGSSGSRTAHLRHTLNLVESGKLNPATALAAVGGMKALWEGIDGVAKARVAGKTVIFPHCPDMPLTEVEALPNAVPGIEKTLSETGLYTMKTEREIFRTFGV